MFLALILSIVIILQTFDKIMSLRTLWYNYSVVEVPLNQKENFVDITKQFNPLRGEIDDIVISVTPLYWHVPKSGGTMVHDYYGECFSLIEASELGIVGHENNEVRSDFLFEFHMRKISST